MNTHDFPGNWVGQWVAGVPRSSGDQQLISPLRLCVRVWVGVCTALVVFFKSKSGTRGRQTGSDTREWTIERTSYMGACRNATSKPNADADFFHTNISLVFYVPRRKSSNHRFIPGEFINSTKMDDWRNLYGNRDTSLESYTLVYMYYFWNCIQLHIYTIQIAESREIEINHFEFQITKVYLL